MLFQVVVAHGLRIPDCWTYFKRGPSSRRPGPARRLALERLARPVPYARSGPVTASARETALCLAREWPLLRPKNCLQPIFYRSSDGTFATAK
jgi:hypothetical protein